MSTGMCAGATWRALYSRSPKTNSDGVPSTPSRRRSLPENNHVNAENPSSVPTNRHVSDLGDGPDDVAYLPEASTADTAIAEKRNRDSSGRLDAGRLRCLAWFIIASACIA